MSVVAQHIPTYGPAMTKVLVKGAPETLQKLLREVPAKYEEAYKYYTKQGFRLLALASKIVK
jgi:magnesium-transporting ATPase (P-type)